MDLVFSIIINNNNAGLLISYVPYPKLNLVSRSPPTQCLCQVSESELLACSDDGKAGIPMGILDVDDVYVQQTADTCLPTCLLIYSPFYYLRIM